MKRLASTHWAPRLTTHLALTVGLAVGLLGCGGDLVGLVAETGPPLIHDLSPEARELSWAEGQASYSVRILVEDEAAVDALLAAEEELMSLIDGALLAHDHAELGPDQDLVGIEDELAVLVEDFLASQGAPVSAGSTEVVLTVESWEAS